MKDGIILIDKESGMTSRDVVNVISKKFNTRKVGHTGTLDPLATGLMIVCVNKGTKLVELLTNHDKSYIAKVKLGLKTDTYDITGSIIEENYDYHLEKEKTCEVLNSFVGTYLQEVPIYSAIKVNGKKLYEYARNNERVNLPKHQVTIKEIKLLEFNQYSFSFYVSVSKGTYIRSLINDISNKLGIPATMEGLRRISVDQFDIKDAKKVEDVTIDDIIDIKESLNIPKIVVNGILEKKIKNGAKIDNIYEHEMIMFIDNGDNVLAIYKKYNEEFMKPYKMF